MSVLAHQLDRTITIGAPPATVFRYFTDSSRWAAWWGVGSTIDPRPGGRVYIRYPGAVEVVGEVVELSAPSRIVFTYGFVSGKPIGPGESRVTIRLEPAARGTTLRLVHEFAEPTVRDEHVQGWRYQLSLFANVVADEVHADPGTLVDQWFEVWSETDDATRTGILEAIASPAVQMRDRFSSVDGVDELTRHIGAAQRFMPGMRLQRDGPAKHCQGTVVADWNAVGPDGQARGRGTNVFILSPEGKIEAVTGIWKT